MKNLTLIAPWILMLPYAERLRKEENDECPRGTTFERVVNTDMMDGGFNASVPRWRRAFYRFIPPSFALPIEAYIVRRRYRVVISWTDMNALIFALLLKMTGRRKPHVALMFWISKPAKARLLRFVYSRIDRIILWTSAHREFATQVLGIPESKIVAIPYYVDEQFFRPSPRPGGGDMICSAGREMRDYPTLIRAMRSLDIRCHIAAGKLRGITEPTFQAIADSGPLPGNVTVGMLSPVESSRSLRPVQVRRGPVAPDRLRQWPHGDTRGNGDGQGGDLLPRERPARRHCRGRNRPPRPPGGRRRAPGGDPLSVGPRGCRRADGRARPSGCRTPSLLGWICQFG